MTLINRIGSPETIFIDSIFYIIISNDDMDPNCDEFIFDIHSVLTIFQNYKIIRITL